MNKSPIILINFRAHIRTIARPRTRLIDSANRREGNRVFTLAKLARMLSTRTRRNAFADARRVIRHASRAYGTRRRSPIEVDRQSLVVVVADAIVPR